MKTCPHCHAIHPDELTVCPSDNTPLVESEEWPADTVVDGKYRILSKVSQDIACVVYKALQLNRRQFRLLRVLRPDLATNRDLVKLFKSGANELKNLQHANVAEVEGIDETRDGRPFVIMEYPNGRNLKETIEKDGPLAPLRACALAKQVAAGLEAAHAAGMLHRDIKPEYIYLLGRLGREKIKLLGFGNSQLKEAIVDGQFRTSPDTVIGTVQYLSPEQALGRPSKEVDGRADLYSLGVVLYQMLTGELPFQAAHASDWMIAHIEVNPIPIRVAHADLGIPDILTNMVMHCMQKDPKQRPPNAREFIREIEIVAKEVKRIEKARIKAAQPAGKLVLQSWKFWKT